MSEVESCWYSKFWKAKETEEFNKWWLDSYGPLSPFREEDEWCASEEEETANIIGEKDSH